MLILSAGHYPNARGACFGEFCEHDEATRWVSTIVRHINYRVGVLITPSLDLSGKVKWINLQQSPTLAVEIHFNSDPKHKGRGSETLYCPKSEKGRMIASAVQNAMSSILKPNRGIKEGWYRMDRPGHEDYPGDIEGDEKPDYFLKATKCPALILEPEFIHNRDTIELMREPACQAIADAIVKECL